MSTVKSEIKTKWLQYAITSPCYPPSLPQKMSRRFVYVISDRTGITAEALGHSLLSQFPTVNFKTETLPFVDTELKAGKVVEKINQIKDEEGIKPLIFATLVDDDIRRIIANCDGVFFDLFDTFVGPLESALGIDSSHSVGQSHGVTNINDYTARISAVNYSMATDDGVEVDHYQSADMIAIGVSRSGKTPTCLYLSLHYGVMAANYPLTEDDSKLGQLPPALTDHKDKLFGLTIEPFRLQQIRQERYNRESYASAKQCQWEVAQAEALFRQHKLPFINTTQMSIEEIGTTIMHKAGLKRKI